MRHFFLFIVLLLNLGMVGYSQADSIQPVTWSFSSARVEGGKVTVSMKAVINEGWKLFSTTASDDEPNTRVIVDTAIRSRVVSIIEEGNLKQEKEPLLDGLLVKYFEGQALFKVTMDVNAGQKELGGSIDYMALKGQEIVGPLPAKFRFSIQADGTLSQATTTLKEISASESGLKRASIELNKPASNCGGTGVETAGSGLLGIFFIGFLGGLVALLTPCVFPMIPLTVSFFTKKSGTRKKGILDASLYGFFILLIYVLLSIPFHFLDSSNPEVLNSISTNVWLNLVFFVIFVVFALSFFGLFEITLPSSIANKADEKSQVGGLVGIFFMALTLALVSFSCTGPILGSLLAGSLSTNGGAMQLTMGMAGFGLALALPFTVFALFPSLLSALPRSGGWLTTVKIVLGFLELALAVKFLSNADLVQHWGILKREVFFAIWIIIGILLSLYLFGILRFSHEGKPKLTKVRLALGVLVAAFTIYLIPGLTTTKYANRALVSGFPPPLNYSIHGKDAFKGVEANVVNDYQAAVALARKENKPLLIDFTGWACVNCRKMEENVWTDPAIKELIEKNYILVSLYVDDRKLLPKDDQFVQSFPDGSKKNVRTLGDQYATFQNLNFNSVSQPMYAIVSPDEKLLTRPVGYTPNAKEYGEWLECGIRQEARGNKATSEKSEVGNQ